MASFKISQYEKGHIEADLFTEAIDLPEGEDPTACGVRVYLAAGGWLKVDIITGLHTETNLLTVDLGGYSRLQPEDVQIMSESEESW